MSGNFKKDSPRMINPIPTYFIGSSIRSPKNINAAAVPISALIPSQPTLTIMTDEPCSDLIKKYTTPMYPIVPIAKLPIPPSFAKNL